MLSVCPSLKVFRMPVCVRMRARSFSLLFIWLLTVMRFPLAIHQFHVGKGRFERSVLRTTGIDTKVNLILHIEHVADPHLLEMHTILRILNAKVIIPSAEAEPCRFDGCVNINGCPIGIAVVGHNAAKPLD